jgi:UDP-glucose 6-dehydrogenase
MRTCMRISVTESTYAGTTIAVYFVDLSHVVVNVNDDETF